MRVAGAGSGRQGIMTDSPLLSPSHGQDAKAFSGIAHIGVDEAGRGCLAGPVVAAAVLFPPGFDCGAELPGLGDSKKLTEAKRDALAVLIRERCAACGVGLSWQDEIDGVNIRNATFRAMTRAVFGLVAALEEREAAPGGELPLLVIDGNAVIPGAQWEFCAGAEPNGAGAWERLADVAPARVPVRLPALPGQRAVVDGDALVPAVSAASVLAKTARDSLLVRLDAIVPGYGFARHKGYGTREHLKAIRTMGPSEFHRKTFRGVRPEEEQLSLL